MAGLWVWASAPGRSPSRLEEVILAPFAFLAGLPALLVDPGPGRVEPEPGVRRSWQAMSRLEEKDTRPYTGGIYAFADVLARRGRGGGGWQDMLLLSLEAKSGGQDREACMVRVDQGSGRGVDVLVGFLDLAPLPRPSMFDRILCRMGLQEETRWPDLAWVRLLHSRDAPWPEPLRLPVTVTEEDRYYEAILAPSRKGFAFPLRLHHPAAMEPPRPGGVVCTARCDRPLRVEPGLVVGRVVVDRAYPDLVFVEPLLRPGGVHCVHVSGRRRAGEGEPDQAGPLARGGLVGARVSPLPPSDLRSRSLLVMAGSRQGVRRGAAVVQGWCLVGKVTAVGPFHCRVALPGDPLFDLRVIVISAGAAAGTGRVIRGRLLPDRGRGGRLCWIPDDPEAPLPARGDRIWTAPEILDLPKGLLVGVLGSDPDGQGRFFLDRPKGLRQAPRRVGIFRFGRGSS